jgi:hypothetical protein
MGFFGGDNDTDGQSHADMLADEQYQANQTELAAKKQNLYETRLDIIKGQGAEQWTPDRSRRAPTPGQGGGRPRNPFPWGGRTF